MKNQVNRYPFIVKLLILLQFLLGLGALGGGGFLMLGPDGHLLQMPLSMLKDTPFTSFLLPGALLFIFVGIYPIIVAYGLWKQPHWHGLNALNPFKSFHWSWAGSLLTGTIVIVWILVQVLLIRSAVFIHYLYVGWGIILILITLSSNVRQYSRNK